MAQGIYGTLRPEYYGQLTLDQIVATLVQAATGNTNLLQPPFPQAVLDLSQTSATTITTVTKLLQTLQTSKISKPWLQWFWAVYRFITAGGSPTSQLLELLAPSIDETDDAWFGEASVNNSSDPVTATVTLTGVTRFGIQLTVSDAGSGYSGTVNVSVASSSGQGQPAKGTAVLSAGGVVGWTQMTQGYNLESPLVVTFSGGGGSNAAATAELGRQFAVGDFVIWNDPTIVAPNSYSYEIDQITAITPTDDTHFSVTLARGANGAAAGMAQYGSAIAAHSDAALFRLSNKSWQFNLDTAAGPQILNFLWPNMCVAAVALGQQGQGVITVNLAPAPYLEGTTTPNPRLTPPSPGMRTMNGAAYIGLGIPGTLSPSQTAPARAPVQAWESLRTINALVRTAPVGATTFNGNANAAVVVYVCYISPAGLVGLIDTLVINTGQTSSYASTNAPDGRQMPYHAKWGGIAPNADFPPNLLPQLTGALSGGNLQLGFTISTTTFVPFAPDGVIDFIVAQVGSATPGSGLTIAVQT